MVLPHRPPFHHGHRHRQSTVTTVVAIPAAVPPGDYQFHIIANGIESLGVPVKIVPSHGRHCRRLPGRG